jgi:hypothetical protein
MRPIPKSYLCHTVTVTTLTPGNGWDIPGEEIRHTLKYVRIEPSRTRILTKDNTEIQLTGILFYDCRNSKPANFQFQTGQMISFFGNSYTVTSIEPLYERGKLHHLEIGVV